MNYLTLLLCFTAVVAAPTAEVAASDAATGSRAEATTNGLRLLEATLPCAAGQGRAPGHSIQHCNTCPPGTFSNGQDLACQACPWGSFTNSPGASSITNCSCVPGYIPHRAVSSQCVPECAEDTYLDMDRLNCVTCPAGAASSTGSVGQGACRETRASAANSILTETCKPGWGQRKEKPDSSCSKCPKGHFSPGGAGAKCKQCPPFSKATAPGSDQCTCVPGYARTKGRRCTQCPRATYSDSDGLTCIPCGLFLDSPAGSPDISFCACAAGFGTLVNATDACLACPVGTYSPGIQIKRLRPNGRRGSNSASAGSTPAIMPLTPRRTPCVPCGNNFTTRLTQSTKPWDCIPPDDVVDSHICGQAKTTGIICVLDSLGDVFDIGLRTSDGLSLMSCAFPARPDVYATEHSLDPSDSIATVRACYDKDDVIRAVFSSSSKNIACGRKHPPDSSLRCMDFTGSSSSSEMVGLKGLCSSVTRAFLGVEQVCYQTGLKQVVTKGVWAGGNSQ